MRKTKVITALALTVVMLVAMTGIVAGYMLNIWSSDSTGADTHDFYPGQNVYVSWAGMAPDTSVDVYVTQNPPVTWSDGDSISAVGVVLVRSGIDNGGGTKTQLLGNVSNLGGTYDIPHTADYDIVYDKEQDGYFNASVDAVDHMTVCPGFTTVPEFATIAIPVAGILGLVLFFNHRKRRKE